MASTIFRWWAGKSLVQLSTPYTYTGVPNPYSGIAENLEKVTEEDLLSQEYRTKHKMMLASGVNDSNGEEIYEGDILEIYLSRTSNSSRSIQGYVECLNGKGFLVCGTSASDFPLDGLDCEVVGNFFDSPEWIADFGGDKHLVERWSR